MRFSGAFSRFGSAIPALALLGALSLGGCSTNVGEQSALFPLPAGAPERPAIQPAYPAIHDMPPERPAPVLTSDQQQKAEAELVADRTRQEGRDPTAKTPPAAKTPATKASATKPAKPARKGSEVTGSNPKP